MKLTDVSNASLTKIYDCLGKKNPRTTENFARTNYRFAEFAKTENRLFHKIECDEVRITRNIRENEIPSISSAVIINNVYHSGLNDVPITGSLKTAMEKVMKFYTKNYSMCYFEIDYFTVNKEFLAIICEYLEPCIKSGRLEYLHFLYGKLECSERVFFETLGNLKIKRLIVSQLKQFRFNSTHLSIIPSETYIAPAHGEHQSDVDDQLLVNWLYKTHQSIDIDLSTTRLTLQAMLVFIEKLVSKMHKSASKDKRDLLFGRVKADSYSRKQLLLAQRSPELTWRVESDLNSHHIVVYTVTHDKYDLTIKFSLARMDYPQITKQQARNRMNNLGRKIRRKLRENNAHNYREDMEVMFPLEQLWGSCCDEWTDIRDELRALPHPTINEINAESDEEDDD